MRWFANLKTALKLAAGFGLSVLLTLLIGFVTVSRMAQMNAGTSLLKTDAADGLQGTLDLCGSMNQFRLLQFKHILETNDARMNKLEEQIKAKRADVDKNMTDYEKTITQAEDRTNYEELKLRWSRYLELYDAVQAASRKNDFKAAAALMSGETLTRFNAVIDSVNKIGAWNSKRGEFLAHEADQTYHHARAIATGIVIAAAILCTILGWFISTLITRPLGQVSDTAKGLAMGDTAQEITLVRNDEVGALAAAFRALIAYQREMAAVADAMAGGDLSRSIQPKSDQDTLGNAFARMIHSLSQLVGKARVAADSIAAASSQVASGSEDLSQRTTEQASSLEETASSMEEMTSTVKQNADNARHANQLAAQAREMAQEGGKVVSDAVSSMQQINGASKRIADIISVIDEIAFQTNLLALNAAVEAARVGEQGKGFAVVAAEVRNLAGRSATAAKEIKALVADSVSKVAEGSTLVNRSGEQLEEIVSSVKKVADIIAEIAAASTEQAAGIEQVNKAIMQMDQITQENAALVEEASASSQAMTSQAQELARLVSAFKLEASYLSGLQAEEVRNRAALVEQASRVLSATGTDGGDRGGRGARRGGSSKTKLSLSVSNNDKDNFEEF